MTKWSEWQTGRTDWAIGALEPDEILYYLNGPAIFTRRFGLANYLFFKSDEYSDGDYLLATIVDDVVLDALKSGRLSVRGALAQDTIWLVAADLDMNVVRYEAKTEADAARFLPKAGVPLRSSFRTAPDSLAQTDALFAFKFFGRDMSERGMPLSTFKEIVDKVTNVVQTALTPDSLSGGRDRRFIDYPVRQPEFASLLIAIDEPRVDTAQLRAGGRTRNLDPNAVFDEAFAKGRDFAGHIERTVDLARAGGLPDQYAADNFVFLQQLVEILPSSRSDVSKMQFSSNASGAQVFVEVDAHAADLIRQSIKAVEHRAIYVTGIVDGLIGKSKTFRLQTDFGREVTCQLGWRQFDELVERDVLRFGVRLGVHGRYVKRDRRDLMHVEGDPIFF